MTHLRTLVILLMMSALTACASSSDHSSYNAAPASSGPILAMQTADADAAPAPEAASGGSGRRSGSSSRKLIRNARLTLEVDDEDDFEPTLKKVAQIAKGQGGWVQRETKDSMVIMVPTTQIQETMNPLSRLGEVIDKNVSVTDVTSQYVDLNVRIENLKTVRTRLLSLFDKAADVKSMVELERELGRVTMNLERLQAQMRNMTKQTSYATISIYLEEEVTPGPLGWVFYGGWKAVKWLFIWD